MAPSSHSRAVPRRSLLLRRFLRSAFAVCLFAALVQPGRAQSKPEEYRVKAVYLFNFGHFIQWPEAAPKSDTFPICVLGRDPFGSVLDETIANEAINGSRLVARRFDSPRDTAGCRILFISSSESERVREILVSVEKFGVLTVSDMPGFTDSGGMVQFVLKEKKVRFEVNLAPAEKAGLVLSSQLLKVATEVKKGSRIEEKNP